MKLYVVKNKEGKYFSNASNIYSSWRDYRDKFGKIRGAKLWKNRANAMQAVDYLNKAGIICECVICELVEISGKE